jgi:ribosomal protein L11 methylase PrmA
MIVTEFGAFLDQIPSLVAAGGSVVLSGILEAERGVVESMLDGCGMGLVETRSLRGWISLRAVVAASR